MAGPAALPGALAIDLGGERVICLAGRALWWPAARTLFVADVHLGKAASFRAAGVPLPAGHSAHDLARLQALVTANAATQLIILGDLVHTATSYTPSLTSAFRAFRATCPQLSVTLVRGNHDRHAGAPPAVWDIDVVSDGHELGPFNCCHEPTPGTASDRAQLAGHLHPAIRLQTTREGVTLPCFWLHAAGMVLPSFGSFTGSATVQLARGESAIAIAGQTLHHLRKR
ncbi:MAG: ligase-associated DNA damage response endonuclease PdeM [Burkholderiales bacterium]|nr:ligase-associated DNA damage response endonuclease PdeM [Burkholderiales bacterium]